MLGYLQHQTGSLIPFRLKYLRSRSAQTRTRFRKTARPKNDPLLQWRRSREFLYRLAGQIVVNRDWAKNRRAPAAFGILQEILGLEWKTRTQQ